jgi:hypothetical protein
LTSLAEGTAGQLANILGAEREKLVFDGWDQGGIQIFAPGNLWTIAEQPQRLTAWVDLSAGNAPPRYGGGWFQGDLGFWGEGLHDMPRGIVTKFFAPWLGQYGIPAPTSYFEGPNE